MCCCEQSRRPVLPSPTFAGLLPPATCAGEPQQDLVSGVQAYLSERNRAIPHQRMHGLDMGFGATTCPNDTEQIREHHQRYYRPLGTAGISCGADTYTEIGARINWCTTWNTIASLGSGRANNARAGRSHQSQSHSVPQTRTKQHPH